MRESHGELRGSWLTRSDGRDAADAGGHSRVVDMGLSRRLEPGAAANLTGETGTYFYMAPEVFRHEVKQHSES